MIEVWRDPFFDSFDRPDSKHSQNQDYIEQGSIVLGFASANTKYPLKKVSFFRSQILEMTKITQIN